jgi:glucose-6-phosphate isomerase
LPRPAPPLVTVDWTFARRSVVASEAAIPDDAFDRILRRAVEVRAATSREREAGRLPFLDLPFRDDLRSAAARWAAPRRKASTDVLLVGIGGSSRSASVLAETAGAKGRGHKGRPRLHVLDTVDPRRAEDLFATLDPRTTTVVAVSKAGTTIETVAGLLLAEAWLGKRLSKAAARERVAFVCGEEPNPMRARAEARGYATFPVPKGVGGRFSGLSPVGILPAALLGVDVAAVHAGARAVAARCANATPGTNPALALAAVHHAAEAASASSAVVCLAYADALQPFTLWWEQLLGESLGKRGLGVTPLPGVGPSDQHSLLQLLIGGAPSRLVLFLEAADRAAHRLRVPKGGEDLSPASGKRLGEILAAEREATELALREAGRPSLTIRLADTGPASLGALLYLYEVATMWWGRLMGLDPFDQPAVERGKVLTVASLTGSPPAAVEALARHRAVPRHAAE